MPFKPLLGCAFIWFAMFVQFATCNQLFLLKSLREEKVLKQEIGHKGS